MRALSVRNITPAFRTYAGDRALSWLDREFDRSGVERLLLVHGASMQKHEVAMERVEAALGKRIVARFADVREHSPTGSVAQGLSRRRVTCCWSHTRMPSWR